MSSREAWLCFGALGFVWGGQQGGFREAPGSLSMAPPRRSCAPAAGRRWFPPGDRQPSDGRSKARIRRYLFAVNLHKESLERFAIYPAVPGALEEITFSKFKSVFLSGSTQFTFSDIYVFATDFVLLIKYSF